MGQAVASSSPSSNASPSPSPASRLQPPLWWANEQEQDDYVKRMVECAIIIHKLTRDPTAAKLIHDNLVSDPTGLNAIKGNVYAEAKKNMFGQSQYYLCLCTASATFVEYNTGGQITDAGEKRTFYEAASDLMAMSIIAYLRHCIRLHFATAKPVYGPDIWQVVYTYNAWCQHMRTFNASVDSIPDESKADFTNPDHQKLIETLLAAYVPLWCEKNNFSSLPIELAPCPLAALLFVTDFISRKGSRVLAVFATERSLARSVRGIGSNSSTNPLPYPSDWMVFPLRQRLPTTEVDRKMTAAVVNGDCETLRCAMGQHMMVKRPERTAAVADVKEETSSSSVPALDEKTLSADYVLFGVFYLRTVLSVDKQYKGGQLTTFLEALNPKKQQPGTLPMPSPGSVMDGLFFHLRGPTATMPSSSYLCAARVLEAHDLASDIADLRTQIAMGRKNTPRAELRRLVHCVDHWIAIDRLLVLQRLRKATTAVGQRLNYDCQRMVMSFLYAKVGPKDFAKRFKVPPSLEHKYVGEGHALA